MLSEYMRHPITSIQFFKHLNLVCYDFLKLLQHHILPPTILHFPHASPKTTHLLSGNRPIWIYHLHYSLDIRCWTTHWQEFSLSLPVLESGRPSGRAATTKRITATTSVIGMVVGTVMNLSTASMCTLKIKDMDLGAVHMVCFCFSIYCHYLCNITGR
jgi:hypothetical protein